MTTSETRRWPFVAYCQRAEGGPCERWGFASEREANNWSAILILDGRVWNAAVCAGDAPPPDWWRAPAPTPEVPADGQ